MGALYVKDNEALRLAEELAAERGLTKVAAVKLALANELGKGRPQRSVQEIAAELRRTSTFRHDPTVITDKGFYDSLNDEEDD